MTSVPAAPRPAMVVRLVAGRGVFRVSAHAMAVALAVVWGAGDFGGYANALGLCSWLVFLTMAPEKAALRTLPRTRVIADAVARSVVWASAAPVVAALVALGVVLLVAPGSAVALYLAAAAWSLASGTMMTVAALHRLRGRHWLDAAGFAAIACGMVAATAATWLLGLSPVAHVVMVAAATALVLGGTAAALPARWLLPGGRWYRGLSGRVARTSTVLGLSDVLNALAPSSVYLVLAVAGRTADSGPFFFAMLLSGVVCQFVVYRLKLSQPTVAALLRGPGAALGRERARRRLLLAERLGLAVTLVFAAAMAVPGARAAVVDGSPLVTAVVLALLVAAEVGVYSLAAHAGFLLENTTGRAASTTVGAAAAGLVATVVLAAAAVPVLGAVGGFVAMLLATVVNAAVMRRMLQRGHPELARSATAAAPRLTVN